MINRDKKERKKMIKLNFINSLNIIFTKFLKCSKINDFFLIFSYLHYVEEWFEEIFSKYFLNFEFAVG